MLSSSTSINIQHSQQDRQVCLQKTSPRQATKAAKRTRTFPNTGAAPRTSRHRAWQGQQSIAPGSCALWGLYIPQACTHCTRCGISCFSFQKPSLHSSVMCYRSPLRLSLIPAAETLITLPSPTVPGLLGLLVLQLEAWVIHKLATGFSPLHSSHTTGIFQPSSACRSCLQRCSWVLL